MIWALRNKKDASSNRVDIKNTKNINNWYDLDIKQPKEILTKSEAAPTVKKII